MTIESVTYISDLNATYPAAGDLKSEGDDHIRNIKTGIKTTFPNVSGAVTATHTALNSAGAGTVSPLLPGLGAVGAPSYSFTGDTNNGWWSPGADIQAWSTAGSERLRLAANGQLLNSSNTTWGTNNTAYTMAFQGGDASSGAFGANGAGIVLRGTTVGYDNNGIEFFAGSGEKWRIDSSGGFNNLAGGASFAPIDVVANAAAFGLKILGRSADGIGVIQFTNNAGTVESGRIRYDPSGILYLMTGNALEGLRVDASQRVGIGAVAPTTALDVNGTITVRGNILASSSATAYSIGADPAANNGGVVQVYGSTHATSPNIVSVVTSNTERLRVTSDGRLFGTALHNNAGAVTGTTTQYIASGTYTPTLTSVLNVAASTAREAKWTRVGNVVHVVGQMDVDPTSTGSYTTIGISLPIASNLATAYDLSGTGGMQSNSGAASAAYVIADAANDRADYSFWNGTDASNKPWSFTFDYEVK